MRTIMVKERLLPKAISDLTISNEEELQKQLQANHSQKAETSLFNSKVSPVSLVENPINVTFTVFAGIPKGRSKLWLVYRHGSDIEFEECAPSSVTDLTKHSSEFTQRDIYKQSKGNNFQQLKFQCILITQHIAMILGLFNAYDHTLSMEEEESVFKHDLKHGILGSNPVQSDDDEMKQLKEKLRTKSRHVSVKLNVGWKAILRIGERIRLVGRFSESLENAIVCVRRTVDTGPGEGEEIKFLKAMDDGIKGFELIKDSVTYDDSGIYECKDNLCENCGFRSGMAPRNIYVLPDENMLFVMLNHQTLTENGPYEANFIQCLRGIHPYLFTEQNVSVRCAYPISLFEQMRPTVDLIYRMFDTIERRLVSLNTSKETEVKSMINDKPFSIVGYSIQGPTPEQLRGDLRLTCRFTYDRIQLVGHDSSGLQLPVFLEKKRDVSAKLMLAPRIFIEYLSSDKRHLLDNFLHLKAFSPVSAQLFHKSGSSSRLIEQNVKINVVQNLGVPRGQSLAFTIYKFNGLQTEDCFQKESMSLIESNTPPLVKEHPTYRTSKGANYENTTYVCTLQPEHIALALVVFTVFNEDELAVRKAIIQNIVGYVQFWLENPSSKEDRQLQISINTRADWRVQRLNIGWFGSVPMNRKWKMLVTHQWLTIYEGRLQSARFICYYQSDRTSSKEECYNRFIDSFIYFEPDKPAEMSDSGIYHCVYKPCAGQCDEHLLAAPRRLLVIPNANVLAIYYNRELLNEGEPVKTDWKEYNKNKEPVLREGE
ncbi:unnamed protein product, partial [Echinostoma caproni]|uniref:DUF3668 domain-containing protein n=1 Tax=Echinostoma caproni TaxID=27848 RepID=A0A183A2U0_9TREM